MATTKKSDEAREFVFRVSGPLVATPRGQRVEVSAQRSTGAPQVLRAVAGRDVVELSIAGGPTLRLHPANAELLLRSQQGGAERSGGSAADGVTIEVPGQLAFAESGGDAASSSRGLAGRLVLKAIEVITGKNTTQLTAAAATAKLEAKTGPGIHALPRQASDGLPLFAGQTPVAIAPSPDKPVLVFVHGTFSNLTGSFSHLWRQHPQLVDRLFGAYGGVYGLDHHSVSDDPFANALLIAKALPVGARVHLVTHSRGGLVAEALARAMRNDGQDPYDAIDKALLKGTEYARHRSAIDALNAEFKRAQPRIERIVRVAGPARGTLLASGRLDAYLSVFEWGLSAAQIPVLPELVDFIGEVARERTDPQSLPGVEAMIPGRPVMQVLTRPDLRLASELRVVAGDIEGDSVLSWLKVLLTDAFFLTEHDLVVNTNSMYGGTPRLEAPTFVFERGRQVTHFSYFANESSALAIVDGLTSASPAQFRQVGPLSWDGKSSDGVRAVRKAVANTGQRPAVFVLPGIMGSHLKVDGKRVWASPTALFFGGLKKLKYPGARVEPEEPMDRYFGDLMEDLSDHYDVIPFAYDWRLPIEESARLLAASIDQELHVRAGKKLPVRILAHSMGGMVARSVELEAPDVWNRFVAQEGARVVLAGTPNRGAYAPMLALSAMHPLVNGVEAIDTCTSWKELKAILGDFPGLLQLQWLDAQFDLTRRSTWEELAAHHRDTPLPPDLWHEGGAAAKRGWGIPSQDALDKLRELRERLDARLPDYQRLGNKLVLVAGSASETIAGIRKGTNGIEFLVSEAGDGTVPWDSLRLPGVAVWRAEPEHGDLLKDRSVFRAYRELLETGSTTALPPLAASTRGGVEIAAADAAPLRPWQPLRAPYAPTPGEVEAAALGGAGYQRPAAAAAAAAGLPLDVQVVHGNLKHVAEPLLVGHYRSALLTGTEKVLDRWLDGTLQKAVNLGAYVEAVGDQRIFVNRRGPRMQLGEQANPKPAAVVVAGLGDEDDLSVSALRALIAKAAIAWVQHCVHNRPVVPPTLELAAVLVGSGGIRIDVAESALAIVQGVCEANQRLLDESLPTIALLKLVELYGDRASIAHSAILQARAQLSEVRLAPHVITGQGGRRRPVERGYRGTDFDRIHVRSDGAGGGSLDFEIHSGRARGEKRAQSTQRLLVDRLLADAAREPSYNPVLAHALFSMLIPLEVRPMLSGASSLQWSLDPDAARIPWEMLNDRNRAAGAARAAKDDPLALRVAMVRELRLENFRARPLDNRPELNVLVIGEPKSDPEKYAPLPGARREAEAVVELLRSRKSLGLDCTPLMQPTAVQVVEQLHDRPWRIIHVAGHGDYVGDYGGVVLDHGAFLGAKEIAGLATVPELVFVNCCHIGAIDGPMASSTQRRQVDNAPEFAAGIALELIKIGVRCVVAAGWAVDDTGALRFSEVFYRELLAGRRFADAVKVARQAAWAANAGGTTWAAYQCYGDPGWTLRGLAVDTAQAAPATEVLPLTPTRNDLSAALLEIEIDAQDAADDPDIRMRRASRLAALEQREAEAWPGDGAVAEQFANAWAAVGDLGKAEQWYEQAIRAGDGRASMRASEQLVNVRVRRASQRGDAATIRSALADLDELIRKRPSAERWALRGSACKRLAIVTLRRARGAGVRSYPERARREARQHLADAGDAYCRASEIAAGQGERGYFYAPLQWACTLLLERLLMRQRLRDALFDGVMAEAKVAYGEADRRAPDFWSAIAPAEWRLYDSVASATLPQTFREIGADFELVHERDAGPRQWASVSDSLELVALAMWGQPGQKAQAEALHGLGKLVRGWCATA